MCITVKDRNYIIEDKEHYVKHKTIVKSMKLYE